MFGMMWQRECQNWAVWLRLLSSCHHDSFTVVSGYSTWIHILGEIADQASSVCTKGVARLAWKSSEKTNTLIFVFFFDSWQLECSQWIYTYPTVHQQDTQTGYMVTPCLEGVQGPSCAFIGSSDQLLKIWQMQKTFMKWVLSSPENSQGISLPRCSGGQRNVFSEAEAALRPLSCFSQGSRGRSAMRRPLASSGQRSSSRNPQMPSQPQLQVVTRASTAASPLAHKEGKEKAEASPLPRTNK